MRQGEEISPLSSSRFSLLFFSQPSGHLSTSAEHDHDHNLHVPHSCSYSSSRPRSRPNHLGISRLLLNKTITTSITMHACGLRACAPVLATVPVTVSVRQSISRLLPSRKNITTHTVAICVLAHQFPLPLPLRFPLAFLLSWELQPICYQILDHYHHVWIKTRRMIS